MADEQKLDPQGPEAEVQGEATAGADLAQRVLALEEQLAEARARASAAVQRSGAGADVGAELRVRPIAR